jgi:fatty-acyl-CoA synthase
VIQYTSGSTTRPRGVLITFENIAANLAGIRQATCHDDSDLPLLSWLPLYHDMGFFGFLVLVMLTGRDLVLVATYAFFRDPLMWPRLMAEYQAAGTAGPPVAYDLAARRLSRAGALDLSSWSYALCGADAIDPSVLETFTQAAARHGFLDTGISCAYGLAEATLGVTFPAFGSGLTVDEVDRETLQRDRVAAPPRGAEQAKRLAVVGSPVSGLDVEVMDANFIPADHRQVGEIVVRGPSVTAGYFQPSGGHGSPIGGQRPHRLSLGGSPGAHGATGRSRTRAVGCESPAARVQDLRCSDQPGPVVGRRMRVRARDDVTKGFRGR